MTCKVMVFLLLSFSLHGRFARAAIDSIPNPNKSCWSFDDFTDVFEDNQGLTRMEIEMGSKPPFIEKDYQGRDVQHYVLTISAADDEGEIPGGQVDCTKISSNELHCVREDDGGEFTLNWPADNPEKPGATVFSTRYLTIGTESENIVMQSQEKDAQGKYTEPEIKFYGQKHSGKLCSEIPKEPGAEKSKPTTPPARTFPKPDLQSTPSSK